jgi:hypothetical protein
MNWKLEIKLDEEIMEEFVLENGRTNIELH